jgi:hypothetical protein
MTEHLYVLSLGRIVDEGPTERFRADLRGEVRRWLGMSERHEC